MSRTAGLGSSDYTAVNIASVLSVLIGAASALSLITPVFLFLPVVGVVIAALAIVQLRKSGGTQTGLGLAILGLVLSIGLSGVTGLQALGGYRQSLNDTATLDGLIRDFGQRISTHDYDGAYKLMDARLQDQVSRPALESAFATLDRSPTTGSITAFRSNKLFSIDADPDSGARLAVGYAIVDTEKLNGARGFRLEVRYRYSAGEWKIYAIPLLLGAKPAGGASGAGGGGAPSGAAGPPAPR